MKKHPIFKEYYISENGDVIKQNKNKLLKTRVGHCGYVTVSICLGNGKSLTRRVHRLVCETYLPNPDNKPEVNHKDGNKQNNHLSNLEWCTSKENKAHAWEMGFYESNLGSNHHGAVLSEELVHKACRLMQEGYRNKEIAEITEIPKDHLASIRSGRLWKQISSQYNFNVKRNNRKSVETVHTICLELMQGKSNKEVGALFNMQPKEVERVRKKQIYSDITKNYDLPRSQFEKLKDCEIEQICSLIKDGKSTKEIVAMGVASVSVINRIRSKKLHSRISNLYF